MAELKIVATIIAKEAHVDELKSVFEAVITETRKEEGVVSYELHQDVSNPLKYVMLEVWKSQEAIDKHNASTHFKAFVAGVAGKIESLSVDIVKKVY